MLKLGINIPFVFRILLFPWLFLSQPFYSAGQLPAEWSFTVQIPRIALIDIEPSGNTSITLSLTPPIEAGESFRAEEISDNSLWLNYTCTRFEKGSFKMINVHAEGIPSGISLNLQGILNLSSSGKGVMGTTNGVVTLDSTPKALISGIGGCYTGDGPNNGCQLKFSVVISDYGLIDTTPNPKTIQVVYTLVDSN